MSGDLARLPMWLLATLGCGPNVDALLGDLTEEYRAGRSTTWLWWQALRGIASTLASEVRTYPLVVLRATAVGSGAVVLSWLLVRGIRMEYGAAFILWASIGMFVPYALAGGVAYWFLRPHHRAALIVCLGPMLVRSAYQFTRRIAFFAAAIHFPPHSVLSNAMTSATGVLPYIALRVAGVVAGAMLARAATTFIRNRRHRPVKNSVRPYSSA